LARKIPSEVADHAADLPGRYCLAVATQHSELISADHGNSFHKTLTKKD